MKSDYSTKEPKAPLTAPKGHKDEAEPKFTENAGTKTGGKVTARNYQCARIK